MRIPTPKNNAGMALLLATFFLLIASMLLGATALRVVNQRNQVDSYEDFSQCFLGVETGLAMAKSDLENGGTGWIGLGSWQPSGTGAANAILPRLNNESLDPFTLPSPSTVEYIAYTQDWGSDSIDNNGDGSVDGPEEQWVYTIYSVARNEGIRRTVEAIYEGVDVNVWRNAIFGGTGQSGGLINGNVAIHGSVHLLGNGIPEGGTAVTAIDMSGTSLIHNNYTGCPADLLARVPSLPTTIFNGETIDTLDAELRVRNGLVGLSGNSEIGEVDIPLNAMKETMDGTFVNDGWTGNAVIDDGDRGDPLSVNSDNGWDEIYDLGNRVPLPVLDDDWRDYYTGARVPYPSSSRNYQHDEYFNEVLTGTPYPGSITINTSSDFYYNATNPLDANPANRQPTDDYIYFDSTADRMYINGQIEIDGDLTLTGKGNDTSIDYTGRAAILANGNVTINVNLLTVNPDGTTANSFPVNNIIGIMARQDMTVGSTAQLELMGAFYAQGAITSSKQTITMGTFVSNYFDMGTNVPEIYQVPALADNLPMGMIGAYPILAFQPISWREMGV